MWPLVSSGSQICRPPLLHTTWPARAERRERMSSSTLAATQRILARSHRSKARRRMHENMPLFSTCMTCQCTHASNFERVLCFFRSLDPARIRWVVRPCAWIGRRRRGLFFPTTRQGKWEELALGPDSLAATYGRSELWKSLSFTRARKRAVALELARLNFW